MQIDNNKNNNKNKKKKGLTQALSCKQDALTAGPAGSNESRKTVRQRRIGQEWLKSMILRAAIMFLALADRDGAVAPFEGRVALLDGR
ncbi:hypothetical protein E4U60_003241 [Claviceps pazoutovae]|uniref:Uncharacterized protein n=1 Tax=Claviceps pazoutovae TaxID=1649127 RepID=A0A9P7SFB6_9HYPO|nr:hypothetical protein E4U60_003241 [Claviceps pazoutovae]